LETVRQYALDRLVGDGEAEDVRRRHADFFAGVADRIDAALLGPEATTWTAGLDLDHDNLRSALTWAAEAGRPDLLLRLVAGMSRYWFFRSFFVEGAEWQARALQIVPPETTTPYGELLGWAAQFRLHQGRLTEGQELARRAAEVAGVAGDPRLSARAENTLGNFHLFRGDLVAAREHYQRALHTDPGYKDVVLVNLSVTLAWSGEADGAVAAVEALERTGGNDSWVMVARAWIEELTGTVESAELAFCTALDRVSATGERLLEAWSLFGLAETARRRHDLDEASRLARQARTIVDDIGSGIFEWLGNGIQGLIAVDAGDVETARRIARGIVEATESQRILRGRAYAAELAGRLAGSLGDLESATRLVAASDALLATGAERRLPHRQAEVDALLDRARAALGDLFDAFADEGRALDFDTVGETVLAV
jgi:tetratricopeptide (TPR) repeat protein